MIPILHLAMSDGIIDTVRLGVAQGLIPHVKVQILQTPFGMKVGGGSKAGGGGGSGRGDRRGDPVGGGGRRVGLGGNDSWEDALGFSVTSESEFSVPSKERKGERE